MIRGTLRDYFGLALIAATLLVCTSNINWGAGRWKDVIASDGKGYYAYLPAVFIYHDLSFDFHDAIERGYYSPKTYSDYRVEVDGKRVNKYTSGVALLQLPFFLAAHATAKITGSPTDGYSFPYQAAVNLAGIFYLSLGLLFMARWLKEEGIGQSSIFFTQIALVAATPLFYYTVCEPSMSHCYSFAVVAAGCYYGHRFFLNPSDRSWIAYAVLTGLAVLIRPVNGIVLLAAPFLAGSGPTMTNAFKDRLCRRGTLLIGTFAALLIVSIQPVFYYLQTGEWWIYTYGDQHLELSHPHLADFLFSYRKGFFLYTPFALLCLFGCWSLRKSPWRLAALLSFLFTVVWVLSSWNVWWYGGSFSQRAMVEFLPFFGFLFASGLDRSGRGLRGLLISMAVASVMLCQLQTYQYRYYLIHWEKMDREHYWSVFLKTSGIGTGENPNKDLY